MTALEIENVDLVDLDLSSSSMYTVHFITSQVKNCLFQNMNIGSFEARATSFKGCDFSNSQMKGCDFSDCLFDGVEFYAIDTDNVILRDSPNLIKLASFPVAIRKMKKWLASPEAEIFSANSRQRYLTYLNSYSSHLLPGSATGFLELTGEVGGDSFDRMTWVGLAAIGLADVSSGGKL